MVRSALHAFMAVMRGRGAVENDPRMAVFVDGDGISAHHADLVLQHLARTETSDGQQRY